MDLKGRQSLYILLFLFLDFELSCGAGRQLVKCPKVIQKLGSNVMLPLEYEGKNKNISKSIRILVTMETSPLGSTIQKKIVSLNPSEGSSPPKLEGYKFHLENLTLEILESKKEDEGWYTLTLEQNTSVELFCLQLKLYEEVSTPEIKVLNRTQESGNCSLMLACSAKRGDHVVYSWSTETDVPLLSLANSSHLLYLTLGPQYVSTVYVCTASNPISNRTQTFLPWPICNPNVPEPNPWAAWIVCLSIGAIVVAMIIYVIIQLVRRRGKAGLAQPAVEAKSLTIYAQVQNSGAVQKTPEFLPAHDPCTTIYVAAAEPIPDPVPEPVQDPNSITVYASVTLPDS
ncbi:signaling lymphocytic activation molecule [Echinops telfairi]|uniref:Signaling lymphocytic activation molecule n=1 Tax=Echinops telfairi TaxID=9371 RepID=A0ABM0J7E8_ECHTE|nr:signaling lymphocytic activation molecule [Echinops telfairi]